MKNKNILVTLCLSMALTACAGNQAPNQNPVSDETISAALDENDQAVENSKEIATETDQEDKTTAKVDDDKIDHDKWREMITEIGEFSPVVANNLTDEQLDELIEKANDLSEETGYWDVKDFLFQELGTLYPELSNKFPLESVANKYYETAAEEATITGKYDYERRVMADKGYPAGDVWNLSDKDIEDAFHEAYKEDPEAYYEDYLDKAAEILFGEEVAEDTDQATSQTDQENEVSTGDAPASTNETKADEAAAPKKQQLRRFGSSQVDYDALKASLIQYYEFSPSSVNQMTNEDIDIAYTRAMDRLEETGFGDIGLIFEELGKMYPGSSTMYPGQ